LWVVVELVGELAFTRWPGCREALVGHPAEQLHLGLHHLVELELVAVVAAVVLEGPATVLVALGPARILEESVHGHELGHHQLAHLIPPSRLVPFYLRPKEAGRLIEGGLEPAPVLGIRA